MKKLTFKELISLVKSGIKPVITVTKKMCDNIDFIYNEGMRVRITNVKEDYGDCVELTFDGTEFDAYNRTIANKEWYDEKTESHTATYFEYYKNRGFKVPLVESWSFSILDIEDGSTEKEFGHFEVEEGLNNSVFFLYQKDVAVGCKMSYVQWLEDKVMATLL